MNKLPYCMCLWAYCMSLDVVIFCYVLCMDFIFYIKYVK
jgi:hypothetical protein